MFEKNEDCVDRLISHKKSVLKKSEELKRIKAVSRFNMLLEILFTQPLRSGRI